MDRLYVGFVRRVLCSLQMHDVEFFSRESNLSPPDLLHVGSDDRLSQRLPKNSLQKNINQMALVFGAAFVVIE